MKKILLITVLLFLTGCPAEPVNYGGFVMSKYYYKIKLSDGNGCAYPYFLRLNEMTLVYENTNYLDVIYYRGGGVDVQVQFNNCSLVFLWNVHNLELIEKLPVEIYVRSLVTNSEAYFEGELDVLDSSNTQECILKDNYWTDKALNLCFESLPENAVIELRQESLIDWEDVYEESCTDYVSGQ